MQQMKLIINRDSMPRELASSHPINNSQNSAFEGHGLLPEELELSTHVNMNSFIGHLLMHKCCLQVAT